MCAERKKSWTQTIVHWVRYRFDIGYRLLLERELEEQRCRQKNETEQAKLSARYGGKDDLFSQTMRQLYGIS